ncbi:hypothetical protein [Roseinatronobacter alkalisoli]|uniref:Uncharacterized protein n=1 Tax=Roseinatronobacter alkalisoli TaxID=3028235 RepID=A0ABT5T849_9RHOB|nr:hypothetical protein [Roseinatronobacter sp. HJB301]MDD7971302.1 hypothetical protein [Roseinatronobacter sp. HJB301]
MSTKTFTFEGDGYKFEVELTLDADGNVTAKVTAVEGSADFNAFFWSDGDDTADFDGFSRKESSLNMNGEGSKYEGEDGVEDVLWDGAHVNSLPGLGKEGEGKQSFVGEGDTKTFDLAGMTAEDFENLEYFGIRATSVNGDGSLKLVEKPEEDMDPPPETDFFPEWPQDISNAVFYIDTTGDGEWDLAVKIDSFPDDDEIGWISNDMDDFYACMFEYIKKVDDRVDDDSTLIGVSIKGGTSDDAFFLIEGDENGPEPDEGPTMNTGPGTTEYEYEDFYDFYQEDCVA